MADETLSRADEVAEVAIGRGPRLVLVLEGERPMSGSLSMDLARIDAVLLGREVLISTDGPDELRAPCDDCTILMPARATIVGREGVYLSRPLV